jgi:hypothetical protein
VAFVRVNDREDVLAAAVLATVAGWHGNAGSVRIREAQLAQAVELLAPAEACRELAQPNLAAWRDLAGWDWRGATVLAVFDPDPEAPSADPHVIALREVIASGRQQIPAGDLRPWQVSDGGDHPLLARWRARWPDRPPIGHRLKRLDDRWVRFHGLPGAKRYADTEAELDTILQRHDALVGGLLAGAVDLLVITLEVGFRPTPRDRSPLLERLLPGADAWAVLSGPYLEPQLAFAHLYVNQLTWRPAGLDPLLRAVADDQIDHVILAPPDLGWLYAPCDGGADAVLATPALRDQLRDRHRAWAADIAGGRRHDG